MPRAILILLFTSCCLFTRAQEGKHFVFTHLGKKDGLLSERVYSIHQGKDGFMWLATSNGLYRYDGQTVLRIHADAGGDPFPNQCVLQVLEDAQRNLWLQFGENNYGILNTSSWQFRRVTLDVSDKSAIGSIAKLVIDEAGRTVLLLQGRGLLTYYPNRNEFSARYNFIRLPDSWSPMSLNYDSLNKCYWIGTREGLVKYNTRTGQISYRGHNTDNEWAIDDDERQRTVLNVFTDYQNRQWVVSWTNNQPQYLVCHDGKKKTRTYYQSQFDKSIREYYQVQGFIQQPNGAIWSYGVPYLSSFNEKDNQFEFLSRQMVDHHVIEYDEVFQLYSDREQNLWAATDKGVYIFNPRAQVFSTIRNTRTGDNVVKKKPVTSILQTRENEIWVSTWGEGIFVYDNDYKPLSKDLGNISGGIWSLCQRKTGDIWIGAQAGWLGIHDQRTGKNIYYQPAAAMKRTIRQIVEDGKGNLWLATQGGRILKWDPVAGSKNIDNGFSIAQELAHIIHRLYIDKQDNLWICTLETGLYKINTANGQVIGHYSYRPGSDNSLGHLSPSDVIQYNDSLMLIAGSTLDVLNLCSNKITSVTEKEGLPSSMLQNLVRDRNGFVWIGTAEGLLRYNLEKNIFSIPSRQEGFIDEYIEMGPATLLKDGRITMGTSHDVLVFDPRKTFADLEVPPVHITEFFCGSLLLSPDSLLKMDRVTLDYRKTGFSLSFSTMSELQKNQLTYYYKLEGIDKDWIQTNGLQKVQYNYLPSGNYVFRIKAVNGYGKSSPVTMMKIYVRPPFWKTGWFIALLALTTMLIGYFFHQSAIFRQKKEQDMRNRIAANLNNEISTTLGNVNVLSEMVRMKISIDSEMAKEYILKITESSSQTIEAMNDIVWSINPENDSMPRLVERMKALAQEILTPRTIIYDFTVTDKVLRTQMNMQDRHELLILFKTLLKTVADHSQCYRVNIEFSRVGPHLQLLLENDGRHFKPEEISKLPSIKEITSRTEMLNGGIDFHNATGKGTRLAIRIGSGQVFCRQ